MSAFIKNIQPGQENEKASHLAVKGFLNALAFAHSNFQIAADREFIMQRIFEACAHPLESIRFTSMQIVVELAR